MISAIEIYLKFLFMPKYDGEITKMRMGGVSGDIIADIERFVR